MFQPRQTDKHILWYGSLKGLSREMEGGIKVVWYQLKGLFKPNILRGKKAILLKGQLALNPLNAIG